MTTNMVMGRNEWAFLVVLSIVWGGSFFFGKLALNDLPPFVIVFGRVALAALVLNVIVVAQGYRMPRSLRQWAPFLGMGALNNLIPFSLIFWGQTQIASSLAAILNATTPLFAVVLAHLLTADERMTAGRASGVLLGLVGVVVMIGPQALAGLGVNVLAQIAVIVAALSYACAGIFGRRFGALPPLVTATGQLSASTALMVPVVVVVNPPWALSMPSLDTWAALCGLAFLSTALAYIIYFRLLAVAGATNLLLVTFLIPISALVLGMSILGEQLHARDVVGMALIALGLAAIDGRPGRWVWSLQSRTRHARGVAASGEATIPANRSVLRHPPGGRRCRRPYGEHRWTRE
jgi:drug/metabolite transporter (DMT)-like permease